MSNGDGDGKLVSLKRPPPPKGKAAGNGKGGLAIMLGGGGGPSADYAGGSRFDIEGDHAKQMFGGKLPPHKTPVQFHGKGFVDRSESSDSPRVSVQMTHAHVRPTAGGNGAANPAAEQKASIRKSLNAAFKQQTSKR